MGAEFRKPQRGVSAWLSAGLHRNWRKPRTGSEEGAGYYLRGGEGSVSSLLQGRGRGLLALAWCRFL